MQCRTRGDITGIAYFSGRCWEINCHGRVMLICRGQKLDDVLAY